MKHSIKLSKERLEQRHQDNIENQAREMRILTDNLEIYPGYHENEQLAIKLIQQLKVKFNLIF